MLKANTKYREDMYNAGIPVKELPQASRRGPVKELPSGAFTDSYMPKGGQPGKPPAPNGLSKGGAPKPPPPITLALQNIPPAPKRPPPPRLYSEEDAMWWRLAEDLRECGLSGSTGDHSEIEW